jgi:CrcB protein
LLDLPTVLAIAVAGGGASVLRLVFSRWHGELPWGILLANSLASLLLGLWLEGQGWGQPVAMAGFCGGLSTFSSVVAASGEYLRAGQRARAVANTVLSLAVPFTALLLGVLVGPYLLN